MDTGRFLSTLRNIAVPLGPVQGVPIRLHATFFLLFPLGLLLSNGNAVRSAVLMAMVFVLVLLHECGHLCAARLRGSYYDEMILWPLGGLAHAETPLKPTTQFVVAAAGPLTHLVIAVLFLPLPLDASPFHLWPLPADGATGGGYGGYPLLFLTLNRLLLVANVIPVFLTDGGRLWQGILWHFFGFGKATIATMLLSFALAGGCLVYGINAQVWPLVVAGSILLLSGLLYHRSLRVAEVIDGRWIETPALFGGYRRRKLAVRLRDWRGKRRQERDHLKRVRDTQELDALLEKINRVGLAGLTARERRFLQKQSNRLQQRRGMTLK